MIYVFDLDNTLCDTKKKLDGICIKLFLFTHEWVGTREILLFLIVPELSNQNLSYSKCSPRTNSKLSVKRCR